MMYSDLDFLSEEIRLLDLKPGVWGDQIECQLRVVALKAIPTFKALSYVWGNTDPKQYIKVNGNLFAITPNLRSGLQRLRSETEILTLWADAVCINQNDVDERGQQVSIMHKIYGSAEETLIWLGYGDISEVPTMKPEIYRWAGESSDMTLVDSYFSAGQALEERNMEAKAEDDFGAFVFLCLRSLDKHFHEMPFFHVENGRLHAGNLWAATLRALDTFTSAPWWTRIWTLQETVLARKAIIVYRNMTAPWGMLARAAKASHVHDLFCCEDLLNTRPTKEGVIIIKITRTVHHDIELLRSLRAENRRLSLSQLVRQTDQRDATDARDKIYGILGLVTNWYNEPPLYPDYTLDAKEVFMQASFKALKSSHSLIGLMGVPRTDIPGLPTWVTQMSIPGEWDFSQKQRINRASLFEAAGDMWANVDRKGNVLVVDAFEYVGTVTTTGPVMFGESNSWISIIEVVTQWRNLVDSLVANDRVSTGKHTIEEAFYRTLLNDCIGWHPTDTRERDLEPGKIHSVYRRLRDTDLISLPQDWWTWLRLQASGGSEDRDDEQNPRPDPKSDPDAIRLFYQAFVGATALRRMFITSDGRMGLGPPSLTEGDTIRMLVGGETIFALRKASQAEISNEMLIGDVYVHGMMDGEGVPAEWRSHVTQVFLE